MLRSTSLMWPAFAWGIFFFQMFPVLLFWIWNRQWNTVVRNIAIQFSGRCFSVTLCSVYDVCMQGLWRKPWRLYWTLTIGPGCCSEFFLPLYQTRRRHIPKYRNIDPYCREDLTYHIVIFRILHVYHFDSVLQVARSNGFLSHLLPAFAWVSCKPRGNKMGQAFLV